MDNGNDADQPNASTKIQFIQHHQPPLKDGHYRLTATQTVQSKIQSEGLSVDLIDQAYKSVQDFVIAGERYSLNPQDVLSVFPPPDSQGDYSNVLAHIVLRRSTLPWERLAQPGKEGWPWLAVLLFDEAEAPAPQVIDLKTLFSDQSVSFPNREELSPDPGEHDDDLVTVIDVPSKLLKEIAPYGDELALLAHVRQWTTETEKNVGGERAVVMCNRLPRRGRTSIAHLVSMEGRYQEDGQFHIPDEKLVRLVSLKNWRFVSLDEIVRGHEVSFARLLKSVSVDQLRLPSSALRSDANEPEAETAESFLSRGFLPVPHHLRNGQDTASWYHGPLIPAPKTSGTNPQLPIRAADALLDYDSRSGIFDVSYASAWEIGRLLALQDRNFALDLYQWKRALARQQKDAFRRLAHLPFNHQNDEPKLPNSVSRWLYNLALLKGLPFNYLVPDERMLPQESLRIFHVDPDWIACLLDGAFSIGRVSNDEMERERAIYNQATPLTELALDKTGSPAAENLVGCLLRSDVVAGWPNLQVNAYASDASDSTKLTLLRMERLSANVLLCLFTGRSAEETLIHTIDIHQKPEGLHSGVKAINGLDVAYQKNVRDLNSGDELGTTVPVHFRSQDTSEGLQNRVINIIQLAGDFQEAIEKKLNKESSSGQDFTAAAYALQMIEGVLLVRFSFLESQRGA
jgi:hypothetical protein